MALSFRRYRTPSMRPFSLLPLLAVALASFAVPAQSVRTFEGTDLYADVPPMTPAQAFAAPVIEKALPASEPPENEARASDDQPATERSNTASDDASADIWDRIRRGFALPPLNTARGRNALKQYARHPDYFRRVSDRAGKYLYHIVEEVEARGMPTELALLPFVESAFQPEALSYAKASGLWQFMPSTGTVFSLQQNFWKDERRDVLESTRAALDYLARLHDRFGDWQLALAAYNWGEGSVTRAIRRAQARGRATDYSHLRMPRETAWYVPKLMAVKEIVEHPEKYGVTLPEIENAPYFVKVTKSRDIDVQTAALLAEMDPDEFKQLNPGFNLPVIVASHNSSFLLPIDRVGLFMNNLARWVETGKPLSSWMLYRVAVGESLADIAGKTGMTEADLRRINRIPAGRKVLAGSSLLVDAGDADAPAILEEDAAAGVKLAAPEVRRVVYRVRRGDTIYEIAKRFGVTQRSLRKTNRLKSNQLRIGQRLIVVVAPGTKTRALPTRTVDGARIYQVKKGDTFASIARRFKTSVTRLKQANGLKTNQLKIGQRLVIR